MKFRSVNPVSLFTIAALTVAALPAVGQTFQRRATFRNDGDPARGKCTIEVVVDGAAEIDIRGDSGVIRNLSGQPAQWRRFECNGPMPANPVNFRFAGVDGRGSQQLVRDPRSGGVAVVRIEDRPGGSEGYTFDLFWENGGGQFSRDDRGFGNGIGNGNGKGNGVGGGFGRGNGGRFAADDAVRVCRESVLQQATDRYRTREIQFRRIAMDDQPGRNDYVVGTILVGGRDREEAYRFSCSVNFDTGRVRTAEIEPRPISDRGPIGYNGGGNGGGGLNREVQGCQRAIEQRLRNDGYDRIEFRSINAEDRPGADRVVGIAAANRRGIFDSFDFSCIVDPRGGDLRLDVRRR